jgi:uncharacterized membrane protein YqjE
VETPDGADSPPEGSFRGVGATLLALAGTRVELMGIELREETHRAGAMLFAYALAILFLGAALVFAGLWVAAAFWDSHPLIALAAVALAYGAIGAYLLSRAKAAFDDAPAPFATTAREFASDMEALRDSPRDENP